MKRTATRGLIITAVLATLAGALGWADSPKDHQAPQTLPILLGTSGSTATDFGNLTGGVGSCNVVTLGSAVTCNGELYILTTNLGLIPLSGPVPQVGEPILQPGLRDTGCKPGGTQVATFPGDLTPLRTTSVDAAILKALPGAVDPRGTILGIGAPCPVPVDPVIGMSVAKSGRTSGLTVGTIASVSATIIYSFPDGTTKTVDNQILMRGDNNFTRDGDDGALMVTNDASHNPVGLLIFPSRYLAGATPARDLIGAFTPVCGQTGPTKGFAFAGDQSACAAASAATVLADTPPASEVEWARSVKERHVGELMSDPAITAVAVGAATGDAKRAAIHVYVEGGRALVRAIPPTLDGVPVRVFESEAFTRGSGAVSTEAVDLPAECLLEKNVGACVTCCKAAASDIPPQVCAHFCRFPPPPLSGPDPQP
jgi:hypothetical protein